MGEPAIVEFGAVGVSTDLLATLSDHERRRFFRHMTPRAVAPLKGRPASEIAQAVIAAGKVKP